MAQSIYPNYLRENVYAGTYCEIAMESYFQAKQLHNVIKKHNYIVSSIHDIFTMDKYSIITIVFSAMCLEAFINDYAAACLGDSDFYENFDKLSTISKLQLIAKFIWNDDLDKGQAYYCRLKRLFKERDAIVHSKSHLSKYQGMTEVEFKQYVSQNTERADNVGYDEDAFDKDEVDTVIRTALDSLKAIYDIAKLFDAHDSNVHAVSKLIRPNGVRWGEATEKQYKSVVLPALGIKVEKKNEI